ncbi:MAG: DNA-processing protein DprA [Planctomycetota bacterium]
MTDLDSAADPDASPDSGQAGVPRNPPTRPTQERLDGLRLSMVDGVGPGLHRVLMDHFGSAGEVFAAAAPTLAQLPGIGTHLAQRIVRAPQEIDPAAELATCRRHGFSVLTWSDDEYPQSLREIADPPHALFVEGELTSREALSIAVVGSRHATAYGRRVAGRLASGLARAGFTVVSGLARGIDASAHRGALEAGGRTLAVLPAGLLQLYPREHRELAFDIARAGACVTEHPCEWPVRAGAFPRRNRIITGLSLGTIVVEAADRSGALTSARHALDQGREVFAVPGPIDSRMSRGCHALLRDGATLVESVDDVLEALGPLTAAAVIEKGEAAIRHPAELQLNDQEKQVLALIETEPTCIDQVLGALALPVPRVLSTISALEMRRLIRRVSGQYVCRV